jgi:hypothetical protein
MSEAAELAVGFAFAAAALYTILFVNFTGNGNLWDSLRGVAQNAASAKTSRAPVQMRVVPVRPIDVEARAQNRMLALPEVADQVISVPVVAETSRAPEQMTDAPADASAGKTWQKHLTSKLRKFTVYGQGEQRSSASASASAAPVPAGTVAAANAAAAPTSAAEGSAYRVGSAAEARPGIGDRVTPVTNGAGDGVRNFR